MKILAADDEFSALKILENAIKNAFPTENFSVRTAPKLPCHA